MSEKHLLILIERKRKQLIKTGLKDGLHSPTALKKSKELDELLNKYENRKKQPFLNVNFLSTNIE
ncbi:aspartyl-phosphate phosphatase Spo0E family protein [Halalkalibacterium ligniniphilum]|uniref:aspartyl-phosphate phosphatase Spo0E family protein n=1 Tax=Halalkalibacterium ligniniphilum TaxID=1134413 RepID=UPI0003487E37|nr:aspartyl-phosphate phosphatase Spo0E family protein [Halalkalibacterium ligniniphilum]